MYGGLFACDVHVRFPLYKLRHVCHIDPVPNAAFSKNVLTGNAGEHYVCAELVSRGLIAVSAPRNNPEIDVVVASQDGSRYASIQVKAMGHNNQQGWKLNQSICNKVGSDQLFVVLVKLNGAGRMPDYYIFLRDELADLVNEVFTKYMASPKKKGGNKKDPGFRWLDLKDYPDLLAKRKNNWDLLGLW